MNILNPQNSVNFTSNIYLKKANDIQIAAKRTFPMLSSSYIRNFYLLNQKSHENSANYKFFQQQLLFLREKIDLFRRIRVFLKFNTGKTRYQEVFETIKDVKAGNCTEKSEAILAALYANGFKNSKIQNVFVESSVVDTLTKKENSNGLLLDHNMVMSDMNKKGVKKTQEQFFLDPWLDFCSSYSGMVEKYKVCFEEEITKLKNANITFLNKIFGDDVTSNDRYEVRHRLVFKEDSKRDINYLNPKEIKELVEENYPELILKTKSDK